MVFIFQFKYRPIQRHRKMSKAKIKEGYLQHKSTLLFLGVRLVLPPPQLSPYPQNSPVPRLALSIGHDPPHDKQKVQACAIDVVCIVLSGNL